MPNEEAGPSIPSDAASTLKHRIVILGGGFAGVHTAMELERQMSARDHRQIEVVLVSNENYMVFQPLLPEMIGGTIQLQHGVTPIRRLLRSTRVYIREIQFIDLATRWPAAWSATDLAATLRPLATRSYSIASSRTRRDQSGGALISDPSTPTVPSHSSTTSAGAATSADAVCGRSPIDR